MTDREALLRAVAANPDDDTPRLAYADCLQELGGDANAARAQFIRLQIDLARETGAGWFSQAERLSESCRLAGRYGDQWLDELPKWVRAGLQGAKPGVGDFARGFLETALVSPVLFATHGGDLLDLAPVRRLQVALKPKSGNAWPFLRSPNLERIQGLTIYCDGGGDTLARLVAATRTLFALEELDIPGSRLSDAGATDLARATDLRQLRVLRLHRSSLGPDGVAALVRSQSLPNLQEVVLQDTPGFYSWIGRLRADFPSVRICY